MTKADSFEPKICSNSVKSIEKLSQIDLKVAWKSDNFDNGTKNIFI